MDIFRDYLISTAHVSAEHAPYYIGWVRQAYEIAGEKLSVPLARDAEQKTLQQLQGRCQDWQVNQARHALRLYRYFLTHESQQAESAPASSGSGKAWAELAEKVRRVMRLQHKSLATEKSYLMWLRRFGEFVEGGSPQDVGDEEITRFLSALAVERRVSVATQSQALNALVFAFRHGLRRELHGLDSSVRARYRRRLPTVLTQGEVQRLLTEMKGIPKLMAQMIYGCGLRLQECVRLGVKNLDLEQCTVTVHGGKGDKDRLTILPEILVPSLIEHVHVVRAVYDKDRTDNLPGGELPQALERKYRNAGTEWPWFWLFPAKRLSVDPRTQYRPAPSYAARFASALGEEGGRGRCAQQASHRTHAPPQLRHALAGERVRHSHRAGASRSR